MGRGSHNPHSTPTAQMGKLRPRARMGRLTGLWGLLSHLDAGVTQT